jgi:hypothetical protein
LALSDNESRVEMLHERYSSSALLLNRLRGVGVS